MSFLYLRYSVSSVLLLFPRLLSPVASVDEVFMAVARSMVAAKVIASENRFDYERVCMLAYVGVTIPHRAFEVEHPSIQFFMPRAGSTSLLT